jgi:hypothetical protein
MNSVYYWGLHGQICNYLNPMPSQRLIGPMPLNTMITEKIRTNEDYKSYSVIVNIFVTYL